MASMQHPDETDPLSRPMDLVPSSFLTEPDGEPMKTFKPQVKVTRVFSRAPSLGDAGFMRTGGGAYQHQSLHNDSL